MYQILKFRNRVRRPQHATLLRGFLPLICRNTNKYPGCVCVCISNCSTVTLHLVTVTDTDAGYEERLWRGGRDTGVVLFHGETGE